MTYFEKENILHLVISDESESDSLDLSPNITVELNEKGELIGIEILNASTFTQNTILDTKFAKRLHLSTSRYFVVKPENIGTHRFRDILPHWLVKVIIGFTIKVAIGWTLFVA